MGVSITVKNIPGKLYKKLKARAEADRRSVNSEIILILDGALSVRSLKPEDMIALARQLRAKTRGAGITDEFINQAKREGRP
jgi:plasmid stability protein